MIPFGEDNVDCVRILKKLLPLLRSGEVLNYPEFTRLMNPSSKENLDRASTLKYSYFLFCYSMTRANNSSLSCFTSLMNTRMDTHYFMSFYLSIDNCFSSVS